MKYLNEKSVRFLLNHIKQRYLSNDNKISHLTKCKIYDCSECFCGKCDLTDWPSCKHPCNCGLEYDFKDLDRNYDFSEFLMPPDITKMQKWNNQTPEEKAIFQNQLEAIFGKQIILDYDPEEVKAAELEFLPIAIEIFGKEFIENNLKVLGKELQIFI
jgi:hypothetical protein